MPVSLLAPQPDPAQRAPGDDVRLLWSATTDQRIRGLWWPRGRVINVELAGLLPAADAYLGAPLTRVSSNPLTWDSQPRRLYTGRRVIRLSWFASIDPATVSIGATPTERIMLCLVPADWTDAAAEMLFSALRDTDVWPSEPQLLLQSG